MQSLGIATCFIHRQYKTNYIDSDYIEQRKLTFTSHIFAHIEQKLMLCLYIRKTLLIQPHSH